MTRYVTLVVCSLASYVVHLLSFIDSRTCHSTHGRWWSKSGFHNILMCLSLHFHNEKPGEIISSYTGVFLMDYPKLTDCLTLTRTNFISSDQGKTSVQGS
jgi:hypothetical protein